ncbi:hypothetical protein ACWKWU_10160 [Chitinophaga lutea]
MTHKGNDIADELRGISPGLEDWGAQPAFYVPARYFENFPKLLMDRIRREAATADVSEELDAISPLLAGISRETPFTAPDGYFKKLTDQVLDEKDLAGQARIVRMGRKVKLFQRCLAAAAIAGIVCTAAVMFSRSWSNSSMDRQIAKLTDQEIEDYLTFRTDAFDNDNIFANVSLEADLPSVLPEDLSTKDIDNLLEDNLLQDIPLNQ